MTPKTATWLCGYGLLEASGGVRIHTRVPSSSDQRDMQCPTSACSGMRTAWLVPCFRMVGKAPGSRFGVNDCENWTSEQLRLNLRIQTYSTH